MEDNHFAQGSGAAAGYIALDRESMDGIELRRAEVGRRIRSSWASAPRTAAFNSSGVDCEILRRKMRSFETIVT